MADAKGKKGKGNELKTILTLQIPAGQASPAPPLGSMLGQNGIPIPDFVTRFNDMTKDKGNDILPVKVSVFQDNSFKILVKEPTVVSMLKKASGIQKGSASPKTVKVGKVTRAQLAEIAERKLPDLNTKDLDAAINIVAGSARSLGLEIVD